MKLINASLLTLVFSQNDFTTTTTMSPDLTRTVNFRGFDERGLAEETEGRRKKPKNVKQPEFTTTTTTSATTSTETTTSTTTTSVETTTESTTSATTTTEWSTTTTETTTSTESTTTEPSTTVSTLADQQEATTAGQTADPTEPESTQASIEGEINSQEFSKQELKNKLANEKVEAYNYSQNKDDDGDGIPDGQFNKLTCWTCQGRNYADCAKNGREVNCRTPQEVCFLELRMRGWRFEQLQMGCKPANACEQQKAFNFYGFRPAVHQCRPTQKTNPETSRPSVCRQCCYEPNCTGSSQDDFWKPQTVQEWKENMKVEPTNDSDRRG